MAKQVTLFSLVQVDKMSRIKINYVNVIVALAASVDAHDLEIGTKDHS